MTRLLSKAFEKASKLPKEEQDALGALVIKEIESERRWDEAFRKSEDQLVHLADEALQELRSGKTKPLSDVLKADE